MVSKQACRAARHLTSKRDMLDSSSVCQGRVPSEPGSEDWVSFSEIVLISNGHVGTLP